MIKQAKEVRALRNRGCVLEVLQVEHNAIESMLRRLTDVIVSGAGPAEVIPILDASVELCATLFLGDEKTMLKSGQAHGTTHAMVHRRLLSKFLDARRSAGGEGLSLAVLDAVDALHELRDFVNARHRVEWSFPKE